MHGHKPTLWTQILLGFLLFCSGRTAPAQIAISDSAITGEIRSLASHAAVIFVGQITSIQRRASVVEVAFRVEQSVNGAPGQKYVMREWAGLWPPGQARYAVGQRVLAFVHGGSAAGFSSPVHGPEGLIPVVVQGANAPELLDIRRVAASVVRPVGTPLPSERNGAIPLPEVLAFLALGGAHYTADLTRLPVPFRAHPPAAMQPPIGPGGLRSKPVSTPQDPSRTARATGSLAHAVR